MNIILVILLFILSACSTNTIDVENHDKTSTKINIGDNNYIFEIPKVPYIKQIEDGDVAATNFPDNKMMSNDWRVEIYEQQNSSCTPAQIGISSPILEETKNAEYRMWGEVDQKNDGSYPDPNCRVKSVYPHKNPYEQMTAYAFCSQKEEKTVLICISQMTDNPKLAEEIFSTFKWLP